MAIGSCPYTYHELNCACSLHFNIPHTIGCVSNNPSVTSSEITSAQSPVLPGKSRTDIEPDFEGGEYRLRRDRFKFDRSMLEAVKRHLRARGDHHRPTPECVAAWREFYRQCDPLIHRFVRIYVRTTVDMDDCSQEVWVRLIKRLKTFDYDPSRGAFSSWLYRVVRSVTASYFRHEFRVNDGDKRSAMSRVHSDYHDDPARMMEELDSQKQVQTMLLTIRRNVSRPNYELLYMRWIQQRSVDDVAQALDLSRQQVWYREHRARKKLRGVMADHAR